VVVCGYPELYKHLRTFTKTGIHFATRLELPAEAPPMTRIQKKIVSLKYPAHKVGIQFELMHELLNQQMGLELL